MKLPGPGFCLSDIIPVLWMCVWFIQMDPQMGLEDQSGRNMSMGMGDDHTDLLNFFLKESVLGL